MRALRCNVARPIGATFVRQVTQKTDEIASGNVHAFFLIFEVGVRQRLRTPTKCRHRARAAFGVCRPRRVA